ncbi:MAG: DUF551 domain-containing protein [Flavobacteriales bacterium]
MEWIACSEQLPANHQRVLAFVPGNTVALPGKSGETEVREVIVLHFLLDFYPITSERAQKYGPHFWQGEGNSNHFFRDVTHWMAIPSRP